MQPPAMVLCTSGLAVEAKIARAAGTGASVPVADVAPAGAIIGKF